MSLGIVVGDLSMIQQEKSLAVKQNPTVLCAVKSSAGNWSEQEGASEV
jgi:hypothetical protein